MKENTFHIQADHEVLCPDDGLDHAKILVRRLTLDRSLVEAAEDMDDALIPLVRSRVNP